MNNLLYIHRFNLYRIFLLHLVIMGFVLAYLESDIILRLLMFGGASTCTALLILDRYWGWMEDG